MTEEPQLTCLGKTFIFLFILACIGGAYLVFTHRTPWSSSGKNPSPPGFASSSAGDGLEVGIAYSTEKQRWLEFAVQQFGQTRDGKHTKVNLIPMGSLEGAHALVNGDQRIQVWAPASSLYRDIFIQQWQARYNRNPIFQEQSLVLSPMVFVIWDERYQPFLQKYKAVSFAALSEALQEKTGWDGIAQRPEWGLFKFGQADPRESNSGLLALVLAAYSYHHQTRGLEPKDVVDVGFQNWLQAFEHGVSGLSNRTGDLMNEMLVRGPSAYDGLFVYESLAIDSLSHPVGRWGQLRVVYPEYNAWNENPYYIIDAAWSSPEQRKAAQTFFDFLRSEALQKEALRDGFRPVHPNVPITFPDSPFVKYADYGFRTDVARNWEPPRPEVVNELLQSWRRSQPNR